MRALPCSILAILLLAAACGGEDDDGGVGGGAGAGNFGACDLRAVAGSCIESTGSSASLHDQEAGCTAAGGSWSTSSCPLDERIGCCSYEFGMQFNECFYPRESRTLDPQQYCETTWAEGSWTPG